MRYPSFPFFFLIAFILGGCTSSKVVQFQEEANKKKTYKVILMAGQSNMVGQGKIADLERTKFKNVVFYDFGLNAGKRKPTGMFGPEVGLALSLEKQFPDKHFLLIKYGIGGSSLLDWGPDYSAEKAKITGHPEFGNMYQRLIHLTDSLTKDKEVNIAALLWMQGERDARIPAAGKDYYDNFKEFIEAIRKDLEKPNLPILFGKVNAPAERYPALDVVQKAQVKITETLNYTYLIDTEPLEKWKDQLHYSSKGQLDLGRLYGAALMKWID